MVREVVVSVASTMSTMSTVSTVSICVGRHVRNDDRCGRLYGRHGRNRIGCRHLKNWKRRMVQADEFTTVALLVQDGRLGTVGRRLTEQTDTIFRFAGRAHALSARTATDRLKPLSRYDHLTIAVHTKTGSSGRRCRRRR